MNILSVNAFRSINPYPHHDEFAFRKNNGQQQQHTTPNNDYTHDAQRTLHDAQPRQHT